VKTTCLITSAAVKTSAGL